MAAKRALRSVSAGDSSPKSRPRRSSSPPRTAQTVSDAAAGGDHRDLLVAMRERIAKTVSDPECPPRDLAALTRRLQDVAKEIEVIDLRVKQEHAENANVDIDETWDESVI